MYQQRFTQQFSFYFIILLNWIGMCLSVTLILEGKWVFLSMLVLYKIKLIYVKCVLLSANLLLQVREHDK